MTLTALESRNIVGAEMTKYLNSLPNESLHAPIRHLLGLEGKRMRPSLVLMGNSLFGGKNEDAIPGALAIEVFHNFTLMHDDIMDKAPLRRGQITVHEKWNVNSAILSGDAMLVESYRLLSKTPVNHLPQVLKVFNDTALAVCLGQQLDMDFESKKAVTENEYIAMIRLKTSLLLGGALRIGAIIANASTEDQVHLSEFGTDMGLAFQIWDDYLDVYGDTQLVGKQRGGDIRAGKKTSLFITAYAKASVSQQIELNHIFQNVHIPEDKLEAATALFDNLNVKDEVINKMESFHQQALRHLEAVKVPEKNKIPLIEFAESILRRKN